MTVTAGYDPGLHARSGAGGPRRFGPQPRGRWDCDLWRTPTAPRVACKGWLTDLEYDLIPAAMLGGGARRETSSHAPSGVAGTSDVFPTTRSRRLSGPATAAKGCLGHP